MAAPLVAWQQPDNPLLPHNAGRIVLRSGSNFPSAVAYCLDQGGVLFWDLAYIHDSFRVGAEFSESIRSVAVEMDLQDALHLRGSVLRLLELTHCCAFCLKELLNADSSMHQPG